MFIEYLFFSSWGEETGRHFLEETWAKSERRRKIIFLTENVYFFEFLKKKFDYGSMYELRF